MCEPEDADALWLARALRRRGIDAQLVLPAELMVGSLLTYRIETRSSASQLRLADGRVLAGEVGQVVVNRLVDLPAVGSSSPIDAAYLGEEWRATLTAWLRTLRGPVLNPPRAGSLTGPTMRAAAWRALAFAHGIPVRLWSSHDEDSTVDPVDVVCIGGRVLDATGAAPAEFAGPLAAMARCAGTPLLGVTLHRADHGWEFVDATPFPRLSQQGEALVDAVLDCAAVAQADP